MAPTDDITYENVAVDSPSETRQMPILDAQAEGAVSSPIDDKKADADLEAESGSREQMSEEVAAEQVPDENAQRGVKTVEAVTLSWTVPWLITAYAAMWSVYLVNAFQSAITSSLSPYILSDFSEAPLVTVIGTVSSIMAAAFTMPIAKMLNTWDRGHGFLVMGACALLGLILSAVCNDVATYAAAQVFYTVGFTGLIFCVDVITMDTSTLRDRGLAYALTSSPYIISAFAGPKAAESFNQINWRWGYGTFAIVLPVACLPLYVTLLINKRKSKTQGTLTPTRAPQSPGAWLWNLIIEFDLCGVILLAGGLALFLLPFTIAGSTQTQWASPHIIAMLVVGFVMLVGFVFFEKYVAPKPFMPYSVLLDRTIIGACLLDAFYICAYYCWDDYFNQYLQVVYNRSIADAGYINNISNVVAGVWILGVGWLIRKTNRFKWMLYWCLPLYMLGEGLLIYFRGAGNGIGWMIMLQIFMAISGSSIVIVLSVAVLAVPTHNDAASALAILYFFGNLGDGVGASVSGAIWTQLFPVYLQEYLPADTLDQWEDIYDDIDVQLSYPIGDPTRTAIIDAYAKTQTWMVTAGTVFAFLALLCIFLIKDIKLNDKAQAKGLLF